MASERKTGLGSLPAGLLRPTTPLEPIEAPESSDGPDDADQAEGQGRAGAPEPRTTRTRRRRPPAGGETKGRKLQLPDGIHDRLWLLARQKRTTVSAVAADILDRNLPRLRIERDG